MLRGYYGWNSRRALEVMDQVFPKVLYLKSNTIHVTELNQNYAFGVAILHFILCLIVLCFSLK